MPEKTHDYRDAGEQGAGDVGGFFLVAEVAPNRDHHQGKERQPQRNTAAVHAQAAKPLPEIVPLRSEYKPLIAEKCDSDANQVGQEAPGQIALRDSFLQKSGEPSKANIPKDRVPKPNKKVAGKLTRMDMPGKCRDPRWF